MPQLFKLSPASIEYKYVHLQSEYALQCSRVCFQDQSFNDKCFGIPNVSRHCIPNICNCFHTHKSWLKLLYIKPRCGTKLIMQQNSVIFTKYWQICEKLQHICKITHSVQSGRFLKQMKKNYVVYMTNIRHDPSF